MVSDPTFSIKDIAITKSANVPPKNGLNPSSKTNKNSNTKNETKEKIIQDLSNFLKQSDVLNMTSSLRKSRNTTSFD